MTTHINLYLRNLASQSGFTLTELMATLAIGITLITIAVPAFSSMLEENRMLSQIYDFVTQLNYARQSAVTKNSKVSLCKSSDGETCDEDLEWDDGWIIFVDTSGDYFRTADEPLLRVQQDLNPKVSIRYTANLGYNNYVAYMPMGNSVGNGTFTFCSMNNDIAPRAVILAKTGRIRISRVKRDGTPLTCPE